jgi:hypothetical protein
MATLDTDSVLVEVVEALEDDGSHYLEMMAAAYWQHTNIPPDESALVEQEDTQGRSSYFFVRQDIAEQLRSLQIRVTELEREMGL